MTRAVLRCKTCGIPIRWQPTVIGREAFCCIGCALGGPCTCDYQQLPSTAGTHAIMVWEEVRTEVIHLVKED